MRVPFLPLLILVAESILGCQQTESPSFKSRSVESGNATYSSPTNAKAKIKALWTPSIDTTWIVSLYKEAEHFIPFAQIEEYQQFDLHHTAVVKILSHLYENDPGFHLRLQLLENNRQQFHQATRQSVVDDYVKYHTLEGMDFEYLCAKQDSTVKTLLSKLLEDKQAEANDRIYALRMLQKHYFTDH